MDRETTSRLQIAEERARRQGHVLEPWRPIYPKHIGGSVAYVAACGSCGAQAFAHRRIVEYGDAAYVACAAATGKTDVPALSPEDLPIVA